MRTAPAAAGSAASRPGRCESAHWRTAATCSHAKEVKCCLGCASSMLPQMFCVQTIYGCTVVVAMAPPTVQAQKLQTARVRCVQAWQCPHWHARSTNQCNIEGFLQSAACRRRMMAAEKCLTRRQRPETTTSTGKSWNGRTQETGRRQARMITYIGRACSFEAVTSGLFMRARSCAATVC